MRQRLLYALAVVSLLGVLAPPVLAESSPPPSLTGESFFGPGTRDPNPPGSSFSYYGTCDPAGYSSFAFATSGVTEGPYPGTFRETASVTIGPQGDNPGYTTFGAITAFSGSFSIASGSTTITGTKSLSQNAPTQATYDTHWGYCIPGDPPYFLARTDYLDYVATIKVRGGKFSTAGTTTVAASSQPSTGGYFSEYPFSTTSPPHRAIGKP
jgi:hypothetical protein